MLESGVVIDGRYEILKEIGRGGMSIVYLAMDNRLKKSLVVKDIRKRQNNNHEILLNSLVVEANMLKKLEHPALPRIYDIIETKNGIYVVMDYIEGESLKEKLEREHRVGPDEVIEWAKQIANVLGYLHSREPYPIIYRDMKPDNLMLTPDGKVKLVDFGIAREYKTENSSDTTNLGTKAYAAPEQIAGKQTDKRTDIYSLGVTLYHLVTGKTLNEPPFEIRPIRTWDPSLPEGLEYIIQRCTQIEPEDRYQQVEDLYADLYQINKLTQGYKNQLFKKLSYFLIPAVLFLTFTTTAVFGYTGIQKEQYQEYVNLLTEANMALVDGNETKSMELLQDAIKVDNSRAEAYNRLIDLYINRDDTETGLSVIESDINSGYGSLDQNNEVLFKVGMTYFDIQRDYKTALDYFRKVDEEELEDAKYYKILANQMSNLNIDYQQFKEELEVFEGYNDSLANNNRKVENYNALANIYLSYKGQIDEANSKAISVLLKAQEIYELLDDQDVMPQFEENSPRKLAQAYFSRGVFSENDDNASEDFYQAIEYYNQLLDQNVSDQENVMISIGNAYQEMGEYENATSQYQQVMEQYPKSAKPYVKLINLLIDIEQEKQASDRNYNNILDFYEELIELDDARNNSEVDKLERRLQNNSII
ncbi:serine/threonine protein kinase [Gracilibacillus orientalis]|uniref:non-specific serine/threonine protein kinase n=1 Tax=Gracilibacillus orientalis TaxID=334253 RepID=A0A1I4P582_9BACI|nr:protein kinase [Gracilibacillus orientalis]SFM22697.1 serine/threonine protein kinase [Gracilibacillus orientalis]